MGPDIIQCGGAEPNIAPEGNIVWGAGPQTVLSYSTCGGDGPHNILSLSFLCLSQSRVCSFGAINLMEEVNFCYQGR